MYTSIYMITRCARVRTYVRPLPDVWRCGAASPLTSQVTKRGHIVVVLSYHKVEAEQLQGHDHSNKVRMARQRRSRLSDYRTTLE